MMQRLTFLMLCVSLTLAATSGAAGPAKPLIVSGHPEYPPLMWRDGSSLQGTGLQLAYTVLSELGVDFEIRYAGPWKRVQRDASLAKIDLVAGIFYNEERAAYLDYSLPYFGVPVAISTARDQAFSVTGWQDLVGKRGVAPHGDSFGQEFDQIIKERLQVTSAYTMELCLQHLIAGKADYLVSGYYPVLTQAATLGYEEQITVVKRNIVINNTFMAFAKESPHRHLLPQINALIKKMRDDGTIVRWNKQHLEYYQATSQQLWP
ncbi:MAG: transporter substrate-binding domain-containing protein [Thermodesulfobacteriota bacterium]